MRDNIGLYRGKRKDNGEWVYGWLIIGYDHRYYIVSYTDVNCLRGRNKPYATWRSIEVIPETVGQYTGLTEFVMTDKTFNKDLCENDIVEVWSRRRPENEDVILWRDKPSSVYDIQVKIRGVIKYRNGEWIIDFNNDYNNQICKLKGKESRKRTVLTCDKLYRYGCCLPSDDEEWRREHNKQYKWNDIVKLGNVFDNPELLKGGKQE
jgi:hypothetical protein